MAGSLVAVRGEPWEVTLAEVAQSEDWARFDVSAKRVHVNEANAISWGAVRGKILCNRSEESDLQCGELERSSGEESEAEKIICESKQSEELFSFLSETPEIHKESVENTFIQHRKCVVVWRR